MRKRVAKVAIDKPVFGRVDYATSYFSISRNTLNKIADKIGAKKKIGNIALYNIPMIEDAINSGKY